MANNIYIILVLLTPFICQGQQKVSEAWIADNGDGTYKNPILHSDYSDPDAVRVGTDYYMTASSFNCVPGLPLLHSKDLVNWKLIGHAVQRLIPEETFKIPQHGNGIWAPCIRFHKDEFYIYYPDPDFGIYLTKATDPNGPWTKPILVKSGKGLIDPSPLFDDNGKVYLTYAFAGSRAGIKSVLIVVEMNGEGTKTLGNDVMIFDGHEDQPTVEGPKFYKHNDYYYIFAPAGGVTNGWQLVLRSKNIFGPYEEKIVLSQGTTEINGPHQGAWINTITGEDWFIHFQDKEEYGRIVHLQPMKWINDWPVIGKDSDGDGIGEPVYEYKKPNVGNSYPVIAPSESDEFNDNKLGLQWQWHANPDLKWGFPSGNLGYYRLNCIPKPDSTINLWTIPNLLMQKFPAEEFSVTTKLTFNARTNEEETGLLVMGEDYQFISLKQENGELFIKSVECKNARKEGDETEVFSKKYAENKIYFRVTIEKGGICSFSYSKDGEKYTSIEQKLNAKPGRWIGAKVGLFALREGITNDSGTVDIDWFRVEKITN